MTRRDKHLKQNRRLKHVVAVAVDGTSCNRDAIPSNDFSKYLRAEVYRDQKETDGNVSGSSSLTKPRRLLALCD